MLEIEWLLAFLALGTVVGFFAGLLGVGGGSIMVPVLTTLFAQLQFPQDRIVHLALATSMTAIVATSISSLRSHHAHGGVLWPVVWRMTPGIVIGTFAAAYLATWISSRALALFFAAFMAYVALQMLLNIKPTPQRQLPGTWGLMGIGGIIGGISALVAIGGGTLSVPFLGNCNVRMQQAIGTSAALGLPIAVAGTLGYLVSGWHMADMPAFTLGYIYLPAVVGIMLTSVLTAPFGARLAHRLPVATLKKLFALLLIGLSARMLYTVYAL
ncbi:MAG: sulfite exporter TauE/SafE family protein [Methylomonas sp.]|nr:sulfite exporter TauE/SafE family protein [Methylomonas sp.]PPD22566.1 MAG: hypothetical protein CTY23_01395 [Methylomonas sp.]PPD41032.1 MAG: hypothetical protein CTY17_04590 [Methylomonas sp.]PPD52019.1 MAG: hypothetical protein CTY11_10415 [Methylomonas sp.]